MTQHRVFVYGTLRKGLQFSDALVNGKFEGNAETKEKYGFVFHHYPAVLPLPDDVHVKGEIYTVSSAVLESLDRIEGHPRFYRRRPVTVVKENGSEDVAWMYFLGSGANKAERVGIPIPNGDFVPFYNKYFRDKKEAA